MNKSWIIAHKDLSSYFRSWVGVLVFTFFFVIAGVFFSLLVLSYGKISDEVVQNAYQGMEGIQLTHFIFGSFFLNLGVVLIFLIPLISMRVFSEEQKNETLELLFTYPLSDFDIVWGKFLGLVSFFVMLTVPTILYVFLLCWLGVDLDWGPVLVGYLGLGLLGMSYLSLGMFMSSLTESQIVSAIMTFSVIVFLWALDWMAGLAPAQWAPLVTAFSPLGHYREFALGILDLSHILYFCFFCLYFLFLSLRSIERRNWKG